MYNYLKNLRLSNRSFHIWLHFFYDFMLPVYNDTTKENVHDNYALGQ